jgi:hypothetical protein
VANCNRRGDDDDGKLKIVEKSCCSLQSYDKDMYEFKMKRLWVKCVLVYVQQETCIQPLTWLQLHSIKSNVKLMRIIVLAFVIIVLAGCNNKQTQAAVFINK